MYPLRIIMQIKQKNGQQSVRIFCGIYRKSGGQYNANNTPVLYMVSFICHVWRAVSIVIMI